MRGRKVQKIFFNVIDDEKLNDILMNGEKIKKSLKTWKEIKLSNY